MNMLTEWLTKLPDRHDFETRLLPYLLHGLNDDILVYAYLSTFVGYFGSR